MNTMNRLFIFFLCILVLSACGNNQNILDGDINSTREGIEAQEEDADGDPAAVRQEYGSASLSNSWLSIKDVDWEAYQMVLSEEDYAALQGYLPVLRDETEFIWTIGPYYYGDEVDKRTVTLDEFRYVLNNELWGGGDDPDDLWLNSIALCDLDRDGNKELILRLENITGHYLILKQEEGTYYGKDKMYRAFEELQTNGIYIGSGGAATVYYYQMYFEEGEFGEVLLGYMDWGRYDIGGTEITHEEVFQEWADSIMSEDVLYYKPQTKNSGSQVEHISVHIHSEEEYQEFIRQLEGYSGYFSLNLYMEGSDTSVYLDDIIAGRNLIHLEIENVGRITARNAEILGTGSLRCLHLTRVLSVDEELLRYALVLDTIEIELDDSYGGAVPTEELLENRVCPNFILSWSGCEKSGLFAGREVCNGASKEWDAIAPMLENGNLVRICRLNEGDYCYTSYEFTGPESEWDCCGALISVRDRESGGETYFDMLEIPEERLGGIYSMQAQQIILEDANFDGYGDLIFASFYRYYTGTIFLWDPKKGRYVLCESAPWAFEWIEPERKRLIYVDTRGMDYEDYYIYEYNDSVFTEKKLELGFTKEEETGVKRYTWHYYEGGELLETLELVTDENITGNYLIYEGNGITREEVLTQEKIYYKEIGMEFFPEFDFYLSG